MLLVLLPALCLCGLLYPLLVYFYDAKGLRRFPAPALGFAGVSDLWALRYHWTNSRYLAVRHAHEQHGPVVRIMPNHISFRHPQALKDIYGHGSALMKSEYYDNIAGSYHDVANATDRAEHSRKRRVMSHIFSQKQVLTMEQVINQVLSNFVSAMDSRLGQDIDIRYWFNLFTFDAISSLTFSQSFDFIGQGNDWTFGRRPDGTTYPIKIVDTFHSATSYASMMGHAQGRLSKLIRLLSELSGAPGAKALEDFAAMCAYKTYERSSKGSSDRLDFFSKLEETPKGENEPMPYGEQIAEAGIMLNAGSDTTASGFTNTLYLLATHPGVLERLRDELSGFMMPDNTTPDFNMLMAAPFLRACLDESLRVRPPVAIGLPRVTPPEGSKICGHFIAGGTTVSAPIIELNTHESVFPNAKAFHPDRWFDEKQQGALRVYSQPFSIGGRACIGRNLAMIELTKVIATVVMRYNVVLLQEDLNMVERFNMNPGVCYVRLERRSAQDVS